MQSSSATNHHRNPSLKSIFPNYRLALAPMAKPPDDTPILELRNLGPKCKEQLNAVGIYTAGDIRKLGIKETFERMMFGCITHPKQGSCINASYLYALYGAIHDCDWRDIPAKKRDELKAFTEKIRQEYN